MRNLISPTSLCVYSEALKYFIFKVGEGDKIHIFKLFCIFVDLQIE